jgi:hypothetical protein
LDLRLLNPAAAEYQRIPWPAEWAELERALTERVRASGPVGPPPSDPLLIEFPRFGSGTHSARSGEQEWLVVELNLDHVRQTVITELFSKYVTPCGPSELNVEIFVRGEPSRVIYRSHPQENRRIGCHDDASVLLF